MQYVAAGVNSRAQVIAGNQNWSTRIEGTEVDFPLIRNWPAKYGGFFTPQDVNTAAKVAVLGTVVADTLFGPDVDPTGQIIRIRNQPFKVVGVMASKGQGSFGQDQDDTVFVPYTTVQKKLQGIQHINNITISAVTLGHGARWRPPSPTCYGCSTNFPRASRTTSWSAPRKKLPVYVPKPLGR